MTIHSMEECLQWAGFHGNYYDPEMRYYFRPKNEKGQEYMMRRILNSDEKVFNHDTSLVCENIRRVEANCPKLQPVIDKLHVFMSPKCDLKGCNACATESYICYFGRGTQIPTFMTDYITAHELGHSYMFHFFDRHKNKDLMRTYLTLRNAPQDICEVYKGWDDKEKKSIYEKEMDFTFLSGTGKQQDPDWDLHPYEWFAEDFRWFFGIDKQEFWGLPIPKPTEEIKNFMLSFKEKESDESKETAED